MHFHIYHMECQYINSWFQLFESYHMATWKFCNLLIRCMLNMQCFQILPWCFFIAMHIQGGGRAITLGKHHCRE